MPTLTPDVQTGVSKGRSARLASRFKTSPKTLWVDRFMTHFIKIGGVSIIAAVFAIFVFILIQILPLFGSAKVEEIRTADLGGSGFTALGVDDWSELPFVLDSSGALYWVDLSRPGIPSRAAIPFESQKAITAYRYKPRGQRIVYGTADGAFSVVSLHYEAEFEKGSRRITAKPAAEPFLSFGDASGRVIGIDVSESGSRRLAAAILETPEGRTVRVARYSREQDLFGNSSFEPDGTWNLTGDFQGAPKMVLVDESCESVVLADGSRVYYFHIQGEQAELRQVFSPFEGRRIASMDYLFGDVSLVFTSEAGDNLVFSLFIPEGGETRLFGLTKSFPKLDAGARAYAPSLRNKAFLLAAGQTLTLRYHTTGRVRWEGRLPAPARSVALSGKYDRILALDEAGVLHLYALKDPHPETSFNAFFGKIWYEGAAKPDYVWQSTGGSDEFEPKLSLVPLMIGTLKGTFYAMLFAIPIALLAAVYTSQFLEPKLRTLLKPTMEIMASLPSVVLGFLAALWLAPLLERRMPSVLLVSVLVPLFAVATGAVFDALPLRWRRLVRPGYEFLYFLPVFLVAVCLGWSLGPRLEELLFVTQGSTGASVADFRLWWPQVTGTPFEQRNSVAVGFMMGFAVIPIIFTITEDALSNVPSYLRSGSLALGASRWQTAIQVVLPTASPGIFSALMIGLGRAIGETMIVVMATGNTPIMDFNMFSGMRTLSANIAVELPEAPHHGTLFRTLFLGAMLLFLATFAVNTIAEILRQHLRDKYKTV